MINLFKIKKTITSLSSDRIDSKPVLGLFALITIPIIMAILGFNSDIVYLVKESLKPLHGIQGPEKLSIYFKLGTEIIFYLFMFVAIIIIIALIINWIIKKILYFFKKNITLYKLLNITIYTLFINQFVYMVFVLIIDLGTIILKNSTEKQFQTIFILPIFFVNLFKYGLYIYGIKISIKNINEVITNPSTKN